MCLDLLHNFKVTKRYGWQIFRLDQDTGDIGSFWMRDSGSYPLDKWMRDPNYQLLYTSNQSTPYQTGYHIFMLRKDAERALLIGSGIGIILKVFFKDIVAKGQQWKSNVVVANERKIIATNELKKLRRMKQPTVQYLVKKKRLTKVSRILLEITHLAPKLIDNSLRFRENFCKFLCDLPIKIVQKSWVDQIHVMNRSSDKFKYWQDVHLSMLTKYRIEEYKDKIYYKLIRINKIDQK